MSLSSSAYSLIAIRYTLHAFSLCLTVEVLYAQVYLIFKMRAPYPTGNDRSTVNSTGDTKHHASGKSFTLTAHRRIANALSVVSPISTIKRRKGAGSEALSGTAKRAMQ
tara:strand:+ start:168 stop:494 length:327 start_codon:yes stop_codon:yes gene_type:complete